MGRSGGIDMVGRKHLQRNEKKITSYYWEMKTSDRTYSKITTHTWGTKVVSHQGFAKKQHRATEICAAVSACTPCLMQNFVFMQLIFTQREEDNQVKILELCLEEREAHKKCQKKPQNIKCRVPGHSAGEGREILAVALFDLPCVIPNCHIKTGRCETRMTRLSFILVF